ncbi:hypothetical protein EDB83DRAFT_686048 [Lactarius deliciosus]|nr:hypothetical protein EDB83DRAFT_686048 [Lactarius deliciosus]
MWTNQVVNPPDVEESVVTPKVDNVEEQLATTSEPEPLVEGSVVPVPEEAVPVVGEPVHPTGVKIETPSVTEEPDRFTADPTVNTDAPTELPTLVAEPAPTADVAPAADILAEAPALAAEEPLPSSQTTVAPETADVTTETSISVPAEKEPIRVIEAGACCRDTQRDSNTFDRRTQACSSNGCPHHCGDPCRNTDRGTKSCR